MRGVAVSVFASICTIFEIVLFFLLRFFDDCPHICLRDEFIIRSETEGCVQGICQLRAPVGRNVATVFGQQCDFLCNENKFVIEIEGRTK